MVAVLASYSYRQTCDEFRLGLARDQLKAVRGKMMALIDNHMPVVPHQVINDPFADHALNDRHIEQAGWSLAPASDPANRMPRHAKEHSEPLDPLFLQLPPMNQYQCIDTTFGDQPGGDHRLSEGRGGGQYAGIVGEHGRGGHLLLRAQFALECCVQRLARISFVADVGFDPQP